MKPLTLSVLLVALLASAGCTTTPPATTADARQRAATMSEIERSSAVAARVDYYVRQGFSYQQARNLAEAEFGLRTPGASDLHRD